MSYTKEQLLERAKSIGASEAAAILGLSPWASPLSVYTEKVQALDHGIIEDADNEAMLMGRLLEPVVLERFRLETAREVEPNLEQSPRFHRDLPYVSATVDAFQRTDGSVGVLEAKTTSAWNADDWAEDVPLLYQVQLQQQLAVTGDDWGSVACLIGGREFVWQDMERHGDFVDGVLLPALSHFWEGHVLPRIPPPPDGSEATLDALKRLYPKALRPEPVQLGAAALEAHEELVGIKAEIKRLESEKREREARIMAKIGEHKVGLLPNGLKYSWTEIAGGEVSYTRKPSRRLNAPRKAA